MMSNLFSKSLSAYHNLLVTLLVALSLAIASCTETPPQLDRLGKDAVILAFGDSLTFGNGANRSESYPAVLQEMTGHRVINAGVPGEITASGKTRLPGLLDKHHPALLVLCHGGNDLLRKLDTRQTISNIETMINAASKRGIATVLVGVPEFKLMLLESADFYGEIAERHGLPYEGDILPEIESTNKWKADRIHPNAAGYRIMAKAVYKLLQQSGAVN